MIRKDLLSLPARFLVPLLFGVAALLAVAVNYRLQVEQYADTILFSEQKRLREHLRIEQSRLELEWVRGNRLQAQRLISELPLLSGITHAWLVDGAGSIVAALSGAETGQPLSAILSEQAPSLRAAMPPEAFVWHPDIRIRAIAGEQALLGEVGIQPDLVLWLRLDLTPALAERSMLGQAHLLRHAGLIVVLTLLLGGLLHGLWFRRAAHLTATAIAMSKGDLDLRAHLRGSDELAAIGAALDSLAANQQRYQAELRQLLRKLETLANASPVLFWSSRPDMGCKWFNQRWLDFTGRTLEQEQGHGWLENIHPGDAERFWTLYARAFAAREAFFLEHRLRRHDGEYRWLLNQAMPRYDADGHFLGYIGSCLDISEQTQLHRRLADSEAYYRYLFEHNPAPMLIFDREELRLMSVNEAFLEHYGYSRAEAQQLNLTDLYPASEQPAVVSLAKQGQTLAFDGEWHHRKRNGDFIDVVTHAHDLVYAERACRVMVVGDITEHKRAELILYQRNRELERFNVASVDRELAMIDLKRRINALSEQLGQSPPYDLSFTESGIDRFESGPSS